MTWKYVISLLLISSSVSMAEPSQPELDKYSAHAIKLHRDEGKRAAAFLLRGMPTTDQQTISSKLLISNIDYAFRARREFTWCKNLPEEKFFNDVLPYAVLDETREDWRPEFYTISKEIVKECKTASEAAQALNREFFDKINVHYSRKRNKPNQSPSESIAINKASCTGLSIILTYACRSVGIPARVVGTPLWSDKSGNHTWVEIWDGQWKYLGADEYDAKGLNRGWFGGRASKAKADIPMHAIWATTWTPGRHHFPMVWARSNREIHAVNVTSHYTTKDKGEQQSAGIRVFTQKGGDRVVARVSLLNQEGKLVKTVKSRAGRADMNDVARLPLAGNGPWQIVIKGEGRRCALTLKEIPNKSIDVYLSEGKKVFDYSDVLDEWKQSELKKRNRELADKVITIDQLSLRLLEKKYGKEPDGGHSLWISLHGGGGAPAAVNDRQWNNQIKLYQPAEGYYVAPRAPTDTWDLWHREGIDALIDRLISNYVICRGVNPDRVYILGYSAGGDGVYQLAPRMADRFAAASMMAGHPNDAKPESLRNLYFEIFMGGKDAAYNRHKKAANWKGHLTKLQKQDPQGYPHRVTIYPELGHWMEKQDAEVIPRMLKQTRKTWPEKVVWLQDNVTHERFYWLGVLPKQAVKKRLITAEVKGQTINLTGENLSEVKLWLSDDLIDLNHVITVICNGNVAFQGKVKRSREVVRQSLHARCGMIATALIELP